MVEPVEMGTQEELEQQMALLAVVHPSVAPAVVVERAVSEVLVTPEMAVSASLTQ